MDLELSSYHYDLPDELIAQRPCSPRDHSRLLIYDEARDTIIDEHFYNVASYLPADSCMVFNNSKVFACRIKATKSSGARSEIFLLENETSADLGTKCLIRSSSKKRVGDVYEFELGLEKGSAKITKIGEDGTFYLSFSHPLEQVISHSATLPIPPYIRDGQSDELDVEDYQTIYARNTGSVAAPTAGLHFTENVFNSLKTNNIDYAQVTLHVGMGTFAPVKTESILDHKMHSEQFFVEKDNLEKIKSANKRVAVGTTSLRVLESLWPTLPSYKAGSLSSTDIFLHPGVEVQSIDALVTNFHLPGSTLLMLVSAIIGREKTLQIYKHAVDKRYRFFSYGDAMLILRKERS